MTARLTTARLLTAAACGAALTLSACAQKGQSGPRAETARERQDRALKDPFGYKPDWRETDITGGGDADLDRDGIERDLGHVIMP